MVPTSRAWLVLGASVLILPLWLVLLRVFGLSIGATPHRAQTQVAPTQNFRETSADERQESALTLTATEVVDEAPRRPDGRPLAARESEQPDKAELLASAHREILDVALTREIESRVLSSIGSDLPEGTRVDTVHCGAARCIVELSAVDFRAARHIADKLPFVVRLPRGRIYTGDKKGTSEVFLVAARENFSVLGRELPATARASGP